MSNEALTAVAKADIRPSGRKFVMMALADYADEEWSCFPSVDQLAAYTSQGNKTVRDHLDALEELGILTRERQRRKDGTLGRYRFKIQRQNLPVAKSARGEKQPKPAADFAAHNPQLEPSYTSSLRSEGKRTPRDELETVLDAERAQAVIDHRQRIRKPLTAHAAKLLAGKFSKVSDPNAAADTMIANGWQGFELGWIENRETRSRSATSPPRNDLDRMNAALNSLISGDSHEPEHPNTIDASFERGDRRGIEGSFQRIAIPARH